MSTRIHLGTEQRLAALYSWPNARADARSLATTILHWFDLTLQRDGLSRRGARATVQVEGPDYAPVYSLVLEGPAALAGDFAAYGQRLPQFLAAGWDALNTVVPQLKAQGRWDPSPTAGPDYRPWRFFLPIGMAMLRQRALQFFHYPPIRLLETFQDYLYDPVPFRCNELLAANGVTDPNEWALYSTVVDATPIAAEDDQGSKSGGDPEYGLIPIQYFPDYQRAMVQLLLNPAPGNDYYTAPIVVYGSHPRQIFSQLYGVKLGVNVAATATILPGRKTPVVGANHPYRFYAQAQIGGGAAVGSGRIAPGNCAAAVKVMLQDLAIARWMQQMASDPSQDPQAVLREAESYWRDPARRAEVCAQVQHQGSLLYPDPTSLDFGFRLTTTQAVQACAAHDNDPCRCD